MGQTEQSAVRYGRSLSRFGKFYQEYPSRRMDGHGNAVVITLLIPGPDPLKLAETLYRFCPDMEDFRFVVES